MPPSRHPFQVCALALMALAQPGCAGCGPRVFIVVALQSDLTPGQDFDEVVTRLGGVVHTEAPGAESYLRPQRVAELLIAPTASGVVEVELRLRGRLVASGRVPGRFVRSTSIRVSIQAACRGVRCSETETCIDASCVALSSLCGGAPCDPDLCDGTCTGTCVESTECSPSRDDCSLSECVERVCLGAPIRDACSAGLRCSVGIGCVPETADADAGPRSDAGPEAGTEDAGPEDAGIEHCRTCTTSCGTTGLERCIDGDPQGICDPPLDLCNGRDDDCDGAFDEDAPPPCTGGHSHGVVFAVEDEEMMMPLVDHIAGGGPGLVCNGGICGPSLLPARTLPGPDGHTHPVFIGGSASLTIPDNVFFSSSGTTGAPSAGAAHAHTVSCGIGNGAAEIVGSSFEHDVRSIGDIERYDRFCAPPADTGPCRDHFGFCVAR